MLRSIMRAVVRPIMQPIMSCRLVGGGASPPGPPSGLQPDWNLDNVVFGFIAGVGPNTYTGIHTDSGVVQGGGSMETPWPNDTQTSGSIVFVFTPVPGIVVGVIAPVPYDPAPYGGGTVTIRNSSNAVIGTGGLTYNGNALEWLINDATEQFVVGQSYRVKLTKP